MQSIEPKRKQKSHSPQKNQKDLVLHQKSDSKQSSASKSKNSQKNDPYSNSSLSKELVNSYDIKNRPQTIQLQNILFDMKKLKKRQQHSVLQKEIKQFCNTQRNYNKQISFQSDRIGSATSRYLSQKGTVHPIILETEESIKESNGPKISQKSSINFENQNNSMENNNQEETQQNNANDSHRNFLQKMSKVNSDLQHENEKIIIENQQSNLIIINDGRFSPLISYIETGVQQESVEMSSNQNIYTEIQISPELISPQEECFTNNEFIIQKSIDKFDYQSKIEEEMVLNVTDLKSEINQFEITKEEGIEIAQEDDLSRILSFCYTNQNAIPHASIDHILLNDKDVNIQKISPSKIFNSNKNQQLNDSKDFNYQSLLELETPCLGKPQLKIQDQKQFVMKRIADDRSCQSEEISPYVGVSQQNKSVMSDNLNDINENFNKDELMENSIDKELKENYTEGNYVKDFINYYQKEVIDKSESSIRLSRSQQRTGQRKKEVQKSIDFDLEMMIDKLESRSLINSYQKNHNQKNILSYSKQLRSFNQQQEQKSVLDDDAMANQILAEYEQQHSGISNNINYQSPKINVQPNQKMYQKDFFEIGLSYQKPLPILNLQSPDISGIREENEKEINKVQVVLNQFLLDSVKRRKYNLQDINNGDTQSGIISSNQLALDYDRQISLRNESKVNNKMSVKQIEKIEQETKKLSNIYTNGLQNFRRISDKKKQKKIKRKKQEEMSDSFGSNENSSSKHINSQLSFSKTPKNISNVKDNQMINELAQQDIIHPFTPINYSKDIKDIQFQNIHNVEKQIAEKFGFKYQIIQKRDNVKPSVFIENLSVTDNEISSTNNVYTPAQTVYKKRNLKKLYDINKIEYVKKDSSIFSNNAKKKSNAQQHKQDHQNDFIYDNQRPQTQEQGDMLLRIQKYQKNNLLNLQEPCKVENQLEKILDWQQRDDFEKRADRLKYEGAENRNMQKNFQSIAEVLDQNYPTFQENITFSYN